MIVSRLFHAELCRAYDDFLLGDGREAVAAVQTK